MLSSATVAVLAQASLGIATHMIILVHCPRKPKVKLVPLTRAFLQHLSSVCFAKCCLNNGPLNRHALCFFRLSNNNKTVSVCQPEEAQSTVIVTANITANITAFLKQHFANITCIFETTFCQCECPVTVSNKMPVPPTATAILISLGDDALTLRNYLFVSSCPRKPKKGCLYCIYI